MFLKLAFLVLLGLAFEKVYADEPERIVGGTDVSPGERPYQVSLRVNGQHSCGGSIVSDIHIATAAHCFFKILSAPWTNLVVVTGSVKRTSGGQTHVVKDVHLHPGYRGGLDYTWENDVAIVYLEKPIQFNKYQKPIPLANSEPPVNAVFTHSGWGSLGGGPWDLPEILQKATVSYVSKTDCQAAHPMLTIHDSQICVLNRRNIGACYGDSGGPLVHDGQLYGITSWVVACATGVPDVFAKVTSFPDFFREVRDAYELVADH